MANIKRLKDGTGDTIYPVTHEKAVRDNSGTTLETKLQDFSSGILGDKRLIFHPDGSVTWESIN